MYQPKNNILVEQSAKSKFTIIKVIGRYLQLYTIGITTKTLTVSSFLPALFLPNCFVNWLRELEFVRRSNILLYYSKFMRFPISNKHRCAHVEKELRFAIGSVVEQ